MYCCLPQTSLKHTIQPWQMKSVKFKCMHADPSHHLYMYVNKLHFFTFQSC